jgi:hypothetical protein
MLNISTTNRRTDKNDVIFEIYGQFPVKWLSMTGIAQIFKCVLRKKPLPTKPFSGFEFLRTHVEVGLQVSASFFSATACGKLLLVLLVSITRRIWKSVETRRLISKMCQHQPLRLVNMEKHKSRDWSTVIPVEIVLRFDFTTISFFWINV